VEVEEAAKVEEEAVELMELVTELMLLLEVHKLQLTLTLTAVGMIPKEPLIYLVGLLLDLVNKEAGKENLEQS
jgi:hypothetical protein